MAIQNRKIITQNLYNGERILKEFKSDFPYIKSNTRYNISINRHKDDSRYSDLIPRLRGQSQFNGLVTFEMRCGYENSNKKSEYLNKAVKQTKIAGCQECSFLIHERCKKAGIPSQNIRMEVVQSNGFDTDRNHAFTLIGFNKDADLSNPKTWGKNAVIIDGWANIVTKAQEGIEYLKQLFSVDPNKEKCIFERHRNS